MTKRQYVGDRLIEDRDGYVIIVPKDATDPTPISCPVCMHVMRTGDDELSYRTFSCCDRCARLWAAPRRAQWAEGWRPTPEQVLAAEPDRVPLSMAFSG